MWSDRVVLLTPSFGQNLCFQQRIEDLSIQKLVSQLSVEGFDVAIFPGTARFNGQRLHADPTLPLSESWCFAEIDDSESRPMPFFNALLETCSVLRRSNSAIQASDPQRIDRVIR